MISGGKGEITLDGPTFRNKPIDAVTIALWINVSSVKGVHYLFDTIGGHSQHKHDQYQLTLKDGAVCWVHHNEYDKQIFDIQTDPLVVESKLSSPIVYHFHGLSPSQSFHKHEQKRKLQIAYSKHRTIRTEQPTEEVYY